MECSLKRSPIDLEFKGGKIGDLLEAEEVDQSVVSKWLNFSKLVYAGTSSSHWSQFVEKFKVLLDKNREPGKFFVEFDVRNDKLQYGVIISRTRTDNPNSEEQQEAEVANLPVKFKLISNVRDLCYVESKKQGCLALLASVCGQQNVEVVVGGSYAVRQNEPDEGFELQLCWNEEHLCWEAETQLKLKQPDIELFGKGGSSFKVKQFYVSIKLFTGGVTRVLQRLFGRPGEGWLMQQQLLEAGEFADVAIVSQISEEKRGLKCHRVYLAGASPVFAKMLEEEGTNSDGPTEAKKGKWREAQSRSVELPESQGAIEAMLHFIYYGGCDRILGNRVDIVLELLEAGEKYQIPGLADVSAFVLNVNAFDKNWFTVDAAMKLFQLSRHLKSHFWDSLNATSYRIMLQYDKNSRQASAAFQEVLAVAVKMGPLFAALFLKTFNADDLLENSTGPACLPCIGPEVTRAEAELIYEFLSFGDRHENSENLRASIGIMILAEFCGKQLPRFRTKDALEFPENNSHTDFGVDYWTELFCYSRKKEDAVWQELKMGAVRMLQKCLVERRDNVLESMKYWEMVRNDPDAFEEFTWLSHRELSEELNKFRLSQ